MSTSRSWGLMLALAIAGTAAVILLGRLRNGTGDGRGIAEQPVPPLSPKQGVRPDLPVVVGKPTEVRFEEAAEKAGITFRMTFLPDEQGENFKINLYDHGCGVAVADFDGDGRDDIYFLNQLGANALYKNQGGGRFVDVTSMAGVGLSDRICVAATFADYDNDGDQDLYVTSTRGGNVLFQNQGNGTFHDVTKQAGVEHVGHSQTAAFFDFDNDGHLDLFVTNSAKWTTDVFDSKKGYFAGLGALQELANSPREYNVVYRNNRDGTFQDVTDGSGLRGKGWGGDVAVFDYNEDTYMDLLVTNMFGQSQLYRNGQNGTFDDVTDQVLSRTTWGAIGSKTFDYNNDGRLDIVIVDMHSDMWVPFGAPEAIVSEVEKQERRKFLYATGPFATQGSDSNAEAAFGDAFGIQYEKVIFGNTLFRADGEGRFVEVSDSAGIETFWPWGIATGDFDNDGHEDVYLPSGMGYPYFYWRSPLMMNNGDGTFTDRCREASIEPPDRGIYLSETIGGEKASRSSRCAATADFDGDGRLDIVVNNFNDVPYLYKNVSPRENYVALRLKGTKSNVDAVGAVARVHAGSNVYTRQVHAAGGYLSQCSRVLHFGLGEAGTIERVEVRWPSGRLENYEGLEANALHEITESE